MPIDLEYINPEANVLEYLIDMGIKGSHFLFDNNRIREALRKDLGILAQSGTVDLDEINRVIKEIFSLPGFEEKKEFIEGLPPETQDVLIILYFQLIDKNLMLHENVQH